jgi:hypothetical protein
MRQSAVFLITNLQHTKKTNVLHLSNYSFTLTPLHHRAKSDQQTTFMISCYDLILLDSIKFVRSKAFMKQVTLVRGLAQPFLV